MSLVTIWGYEVKDMDTLPEMLETIEYDRFTADKYAGDARTSGNIMAAEAAIRNYCGWHVYPSLPCVLSTTFFDRRVTLSSGIIMIQLPAAYVTSVTSVTIGGVQYDTFVLDTNGLLRVFDVCVTGLKAYSPIVIEYTAGLPEELMARIKELIAHRLRERLGSARVRHAKEILRHGLHRRNDENRDGHDPDVLAEIAKAARALHEAHCKPGEVRRLPAEGVAMIMGIDRLLDMGRTAINVTGDAAVTTCMAKLSGMLDKDVFNNKDYEAVSEKDLLDVGGTEEPVGYDDFTASGNPTEIGEEGDPDKFSDIEEPLVKS